MATFFPTFELICNSLNDFGVPPGESLVNYQRDLFTATAGQTVFNLSHSPNQIYSVLMFINNSPVVSGFVISGPSTLTYSVGVTLGDLVDIRYVY